MDGFYLEDYYKPNLKINTIEQEKVAKIEDLEGESLTFMKKQYYSDMYLNTKKIQKKIK